VKLRAADPIENLPDYVARLTFNAINDHFRRRYPERTRVKNRLRYALTHDQRLALWPIGEQFAGGLAAWRGAMHARAEAVELPAAALRERVAEMLVGLFERVGEPLYFRALLESMAPLWRVTDARAAEPSEQRTPLDRLEHSDLLSALWREIEQLRPMQRKALLLNLREAATSHALGLLIFTGTASVDAVLAALEMTRGELAAIWNDLPLDDLRIAGMLGVTRQQVINLRRSARQRLARRLGLPRRP
jgi:hypothetical protein